MLNQIIDVFLIWPLWLKVTYILLLILGILLIKRGGREKEWSNIFTGLGFFLLLNFLILTLFLIRNVLVQ